jgi:dephospho-CoA kinase
MMLKVGLTGGIGSGKSLVSKIFTVLGVPVFRSDDVSKDLISNDKRIIEQVSGAFGAALYKDGRLDRKRLSTIVFSDRNQLETLNSILHPAVDEEFKEWLNKQSDETYIVKEAAILFESGRDRALDIITTVSAPEKLRISRVMERDGVTSQDVLLRMKHQLSEDERNSRSDVIIYNDGKSLVIPQVISLHTSFLQRAGGY